ncbi:hypothetical protein A7E78_04615 [Syntrophotalea acetylenivorans]|uniref:YtkA-like domain-containing protein n=1 Tax=Syntrophotalea acetylenivorans TaxID=1842532 RepID=A0A1L3GND1_9BACT|nr:hypothetical protein [Syntrophotalea acetylenivorans]APG27178.1 hypothetical protein A7E78_04615 [Syntrophotalea acetylenivorans]
MRNLKRGKTSWALGLALGGLLVSTPVLAMDNHHIGGGQPMQGGMPEMATSSIMIGEQARNGVSAMIHLLPIESQGDSGATHHLMVKFTDISSQKSIVDGNVTVKVISPEVEKGKSDKQPRITQYVVQEPLDIPEGEEGTPHNEMELSDHFGTDVTLDQAGAWHFAISARLQDGQVRQYDAHYLSK